MSPRTLHHAIRALAAAPASSTLAVLILTLAIAAATVTFSVVDTIVLRSLGFEDEERLVAVYGQRPRGRGSVAAVDYLAWAERAEAFESIAAHDGFFESLTPTDPVIYILVGAVLLAVGLIAALLPARRAARVDPLVALREL